MAHYVTLRLRNLDEKAMQRTVTFAWLFYKEVCSMAGWEEELAILLRELGVTQEEPKTHLQPTRKRMHSGAKHRELSPDDLLWGETVGDRIDEDAWLTDLSLMRREVDSIVKQVIH